MFAFCDMHTWATLITWGNWIVPKTMHILLFHCLCVFVVLVLLSCHCCCVIVSRATWSASVCSSCSFKETNWEPEWRRSVKGEWWALLGVLPFHSSGRYIEMKMVVADLFGEGERCWGDWVERVETVTPVEEEYMCVPLILFTGKY